MVEPPAPLRYNHCLAVGLLGGVHLVQVLVLCVYMHICEYACVCVMFVCMHVCVWACMYRSVHMYMYMGACSFMHLLHDSTGITLTYINVTMCNICE